MNIALPATERGSRHADNDGRETRRVEFLDVEVRDSGQEESFTITGHAAMFNTLSEDLGGFREIIEPGAFRGALRDSLVHMLWNHNTSQPLASTDSRTLEIREDGEGLRVWARVPKALSYAQDLRELVRVGIARGMSFAFRMPGDGSGERWERSTDGGIVRTLLPDGIQAIFDVSPVTRGAYARPSFAMRTLEGAIAAGHVPEIRVAAPEGTGPGAEQTVAPGLVGGSLVAPDVVAVGLDQARARRHAAARVKARMALAKGTTSDNR